MCARKALIDQWNSLDMTLKTYKKISKFFPYAKSVHLQGWGEPLLHKDVIKMVKMAKKSGCSVSFTTNGTLLTRETSEEVTELGVDVIAVSIAGATRETHEKIRTGSNFEELARAKT